MDIVKTITTKIRRHSRNLCEGWQIDIDGRRITVDCVLREITIGNGEIINY